MVTRTTSHSLLTLSCLLAALLLVSGCDDEAVSEVAVDTSGVVEDVAVEARGYRCRDGELVQLTRELPPDIMSMSQL